ncbi:MAG: CoA transferase [Candidatus Dormibacteraeota bacterium]|uniref:CoA transferase n=2 Tax=Candidatus Dormibacteria TaxID=3126996 RepID=A0A934JRJ2_9BACT|nr:CoA transferase [Candidatus Dormibacteraeota bacterium]MBJ7603956.1 CoA transferase [Candidatus Dormibacteraeota bacterium]MBJ7607165.1 CoA transferase [Candidatus Dormibacteraeota bacterium]
MGSLDGRLVVDASTRIAGPMAAWHLQMLGAAVIKVEPPSGDPARYWGTGSVFNLLNAGKRSAVVDFTSDADCSAFGRLCDRAHIVLADGDLPAAEIAWQAPRPRSVVVIDSAAVPGGTGTSETLAQAALALTPYVGEPAEPPSRIGADIASVTCAAHAVQAALAGLLRPLAGEPLRAHVSLARSLSCEKTIHWAARYDPDAWTGYHVTGRYRPPDTGWQAADGAMTLEFPPDAGDGWRAFCREVGLSDLVEELGDGWYATVGMEDLADQWRPRYEAELANYGREEAAEIVRRHGGWSVPFLRPEEVMHHPQSRLFAAAVATDSGTVLRLPWLIGDQAIGEHAFAAGPGLGEHTNVVFSEEASA